MQNYTNIPATLTLTDSREPLLNNDLTAISCSSGSAFPTQYALVGMLCYRTDLHRLYQLKALPATANSNWHVIADLNQDYTNKAYIDANFARKDGNYSGLRARSTTKGDVGLSNIPNAITDSLSDNTNSKLATAKAAYVLNGKIGSNSSRISSAERSLAQRAPKNGSGSNNFSVRELYAARTIYCNGDIVASAGVSIPSDMRLKEDISPIKNSLERLSKLVAVTYRLKSGGGSKVGLIAQEVEKVIPEVIHKHNGFLSVDYSSMGSLFVNAINELNKRLVALENKYAALQYH